MPASAPPSLPSAEPLLPELGRQIRARRKQLKISAVAAAEAAGLSRTTLQRIERGEPSVTMGAWLGVIVSLGLELALHDPRHRPSAGATTALPTLIHISDYPQLRRLAWQLGNDQDLSPAQALDLYERNWRHVDRDAMPPHERDLVERLARELGRGRLLA